MRLKDYNERKGKRVWLSEREIQTLLDNQDPNKPEMNAALILAARCGLRRKEITGEKDNDDKPPIRPTDLVSTGHGRVVRIWAGKGDKYREVPCPDELATVALGMNKAPDEALVGVNPSTIYEWVQRCAQRARAETGDEGWQYVGPHDLRRSWGVRLLEAGVLPSVVMEWGGWDDWQTFRDHYLAEFSPEALRRERGKVGWLGGKEERDGPSYSAIPSSGHNPNS